MVWDGSSGNPTCTHEFEKIESSKCTIFQKVLCRLWVFSLYRFHTDCYVFFGKTFLTKTGFIEGNNGMYDTKKNMKQAFEDAITQKCFRKANHLKKIAN